MDLWLQVWGGLFYTLNKACFAFSGGLKRRTWTIMTWLCLLIGMPAWVYILCGKGNWMVAALELGGAPAVLLGLTVAWRQRDTSLGVQRFVNYFTYAMVVVGVGYSMYHYGGLRHGTQLLEVGSLVGYLIGSRWLADQRRAGAWWFMLMNASMALLMLIQSKPILTAQQLLSLGFVVYGYVNWGQDGYTSWEKESSC